jgi:UDP-glucose 4-epimerase
MARTVLVTGVSQYLGSRLAGRLSADPAIDRVIGVDSAPPRRADLELLGRTEFIRADIRSSVIGQVIASTGVDTVVHASVTANPHHAGGRMSMKELNVIGTMQLLAACQKSSTVERVVVKSTTAVYGASPRDPAVFTEDMTAKAVPRSGYGKDAIEVESYVRAFTRRRPDVGVTLLRFANFVGPQVGTTLTRYLALPVVPTAFGYDPRLQVLHEADAVEVLRRSAVLDKPGVFNVAGGGAVLLSQAIRRAGRVAVPLPPPAVALVSEFLRRTGRADFSPDQLQFLTFGRVVDITKLETQFGYTPAFTTARALDAFTVGAGITPLVAPETVRRVEAVLAGLVTAGAAAVSEAASPSAARPDARSNARTAR